MCSPSERLNEAHQVYIFVAYQAGCEVPVVPTANTAEGALAIDRNRHVFSGWRNGGISVLARQLQKPLIECRESRAASVGKGQQVAVANLF